VLASSGRPSNSVEVSFGLSREAEVDDSAHIWDIQPSGYDIRADQVVHLTTLKELDSFESLRLSLVAVHLCSLEPIHRQQGHQPGALGLLIGKYDHSALEGALEDGEQCCFSFGEVLISRCFLWNEFHTRLGRLGWLLDCSDFLMLAGSIHILDPLVLHILFTFLVSCIVLFFSIHVNGVSVSLLRLIVILTAVLVLRVKIWMVWIQSSPLWFCLIEDSTDYIETLALLAGSCEAFELEADHVLSQVQTVGRRHPLLLVDRELQWLLEGELRQLLQILIESGREHQRLPLCTSALLQDLHELIFEAHLKKSISFVKDKHFDVLQCKALCILQVVDETTWRRDDKVGTLVRDLSSFIFEAGATE